MILHSIRIQHYRSIVDSGLVDIEEGITVLIGKNEQGKTNVVKALASFNQDYAYTPGDLPNHLRPSLEERLPQDIPIVTLCFTLEAKDKVALKGIVESIEDVKELKATKFYNGSYQFWVTTETSADQPLQFSRPEISTEEQKIKKLLKLSEIGLSHT